jgi:23S rRNA pseudouridine2605 synthase
MPGQATASPPAEPERLQRALARAGFGSRRACEDLIRENRVRVDDRLAVLGTRADPRRSQITVDDVPVASDPSLRYYALNKPAGVTTTLSDPHARQDLTGFLPSGPRLFPVGRLDRDSEGLLLLTNDGRLAHRVQHPRFGIEKEYLAEVTGRPGRGVPGRLTAGVALDDGQARAVTASLVGSRDGSAAIRVVMVEGRKREVRRMLEAVGHPVVRLVRTRIGPLRLEGLRTGQVRKLTVDEVRALFEASKSSRGRRA